LQNDYYNYEYDPNYQNYNTHKNFSFTNSLFGLWSKWESDQRLWINLNDRLHKVEKRMRRP